MKNATKFFKTNGKTHYILKNASVTIPDGVNLGILGRNGAGKSTLLRMLGGLDYPNRGIITSNNSFSWPMGLSGGFQPSMTGRQNVKFVCRVYGQTPSEIKKTIKSVEEFAEIGIYFDMPVKSYSNGMKSRVSFGLSLAFDFDYLIIDESLSVGDAHFKKKATKAVQEKIKNSKILLVSHSLSTLRELCDAGLVVNEGGVDYFENIEDAIEKYEQINAELPLHMQDKNIPVAIYSSDGLKFKNSKEAAIHYKMRPFGIDQAINENNGSHVYLKKNFWKSGTEQPKYQKWQKCVDGKTVICSQGIIFKDAKEASLFYMDRVPKAGIDKNHVAEVLKTPSQLSPALKVKFHYLSEYQ